MSDQPAPDFDLDFEEPDYFAFGRISWESKTKSARVGLRLPPEMLAAVKERAAERGVPYQRLIREAIQRLLEETRAKV
jgi:predicted DNA binding CopG/RHH family protein